MYSPNDFILLAALNSYVNITIKLHDFISPAWASKREGFT